MRVASNVSAPSRAGVARVRLRASAQARAPLREGVALYVQHDSVTTTIVPKPRFGDHARNCFPFVAILQNKESSSLHACAHAAMPELTERSINFVRVESGRGEARGFFWREGLVLLGPRLLRASACPKTTSAPERRCERAERAGCARARHLFPRAVLFDALLELLQHREAPAGDERPAGRRTRRLRTRPHVTNAPRLRPLAVPRRVRRGKHFCLRRLWNQLQPRTFPIARGTKHKRLRDRGGSKTVQQNVGWGWGTRSTSPSTPTS